MPAHRLPRHLQSGEQALRHIEERKGAGSGGASSRARLAVVWPPGHRRDLQRRPRCKPQSRNFLANRTDRNGQASGFGAQLSVGQIASEIRLGRPRRIGIFPRVLPRLRCQRPPWHAPLCLADRSMMLAGARTSPLTARRRETDDRTKALNDAVAGLSSGQRQAVEHLALKEQSSAVTSGANLT